MSRGVWRDDSVAFPVIQGAQRVRGGADPSPSDMTYRRGYQRAVEGTSDVDVMNKIYGGSTESDGPFDGVQTLYADDFGGGLAQALANQVWLTVHRPDDVWVYEGQLPGPADPNAIGIEWEPTATPESLKVQVLLIQLSASVPEFNPSVPPGVTMHFKMLTGLTETYDPGHFIDDPALYADAATFPAVIRPFAIQLDPTWYDLEFDAPSEIPMTGETWIAGSLFDHYWQTRAIPPSYNTEGLLQLRYQMPFQIMLVGYYKPRYRYLYADIPPRRQYPYPTSRVYPPQRTTRGGSAAII